MSEGRMSAMDPSVSGVLNLLKGHLRFLQKNTGTTYDPKVQHFVENPEGLLSNNRHFIAETQMEYQPNGDATTEGQALLIIGHCYAYLASGDKEYLDAAEHAWQAYVRYFYAGQAIPDKPQRWICNWIANGKEPCLSNWPINAAEPTHGGYKSVPLRFVNGRAKIPHGAPFWGEYLDVVAFAHRGAMVWEAINASVAPIAQAVDWEVVYSKHRVMTMPANPTDSRSWIDWPAYLGEPSYTVDWSAPYLPEYPVEWIVAWSGNKIGILRGPDDQLWSGEILQQNMPSSEFGTIQLQDTSINGVYLVNYAVRLPLDKGGYQFRRNEVWHNRPIHTPLLGSVNQMGNAADAELWFVDACYLLHKITGQERYKKAMDCALFTSIEYTSIDSQDRFFRNSTKASTPYTDGISYGFTYPYGTAVDFSRTVGGNICMQTNEAAQVSLEQQSIWFRVNQQSKIRTVFGGLGVNGAPLTAKIQLLMSLTKEEGAGKAWGATLPQSTAPEVFPYDLALSDLTLQEKEDGTPYLMADGRSVAAYGTCQSRELFEQGVLDGRAANVAQGYFPDGDGGLVIGAWLYPDGNMLLSALTYRADADFNLRVTDKDGWNWYWLLPSTDGQWQTLQLTIEALQLAYYQPVNDGQPEPPKPFAVVADQVQVRLDDDNQTDKTFAYYCFNEVPPTYELEDGYTLKYRVTLQCTEGFTGYLGDCTVLGFRDDSLAYCPGVIPFSNIYTEGTEEIGAWHGMPYPGYQYPLIFCFDLDNYGRHLANVVDFLYDAQQAYQRHVGELGPVQPAYVWDRWDNYKYGNGLKDVFTPYHWGDGRAWSGYQPRAFFGAARAWYELVVRGQYVPPKLKTFVENWISWLIGYVGTYDGQFPTDFPSNEPARPLEGDFTGHMSGLWLAGACIAHLAGSRVVGLELLIEDCVTELCDNFVVTDRPGHPMNGSWSPGVRVDSDNGMFFGFWAGEIMRGLGLYALYKTRASGSDYLATVPD